MKMLAAALLFSCGMAAGTMTDELQAYYQWAPLITTGMVAACLTSILTGTWLFVDAFCKVIKEHLHE